MECNLLQKCFKRESKSIFFLFTKASWCGGPRRLAVSQPRFQGLLCSTRSAVLISFLTKLSENTEGFVFKKYALSRPMHHRLSAVQACFVLIPSLMGQRDPRMGHRPRSEWHRLWIKPKKKSIETVQPDQSQEAPVSTSVAPVRMLHHLEWKERKRRKKREKIQGRDPHQDHCHWHQGKQQQKLKEKKVKVRKTLAPPLLGLWKWLKFNVWEKILCSTQTNLLSPGYFSVGTTWGQQCVTRQ